MDAIEIKIMQRKAQFEQDRARERLLRVVKQLRDLTDEMERNVIEGGSPTHEVRSMTAMLAGANEDAGKLHLLQAGLSEWLFPPTGTGG